MANETFRLDAEFVVDATNAIREFRSTEKAAAAFDSTLGGVNKSLQNVFNVGKKGGLRNVISEGDTKNLERTLKVYKQLTDVVGAYGRAQKNLEGIDPAKGNLKMEQSLKGVRKALESVAKLGKQERDDLSATLKVYKQLVDVHKSRTAAIRDEAAAIKSLSAEQQKANKSSGRQYGPPDSDTRTLEQAYKMNEQYDKRQAAARKKAFDDQLTQIAATARASKSLSQQQEDAVRRLGKLQLQARREMDAAFNKRGMAYMNVLGLQTHDQAAISARKEVEQSSKSMAAQMEREARAAANAERAHAGTRYALYEVAGAYGAVAAAAGGAVAASAATAIQFERQFANVSRTTMADAETLAALNDEFLELSTTIPVTYEELTKIATIGAQMGVAEENLGAFAQTVSVFSMTTNASVDETAMAFGRLDNMLKDVTAETYPRLASTIAEVGIASVATETEILSTAESIATTASMAGFSAEQVIGLATAMASLKIRPELARGALQRVFAGINKAAAEGGTDLQHYATQIGVTSDEFLALWRSDPSALLQRLAESISGLDKVSRTQILGNLGINNTRDVEMLGRLANGYDTYAASMANASDAWEKGDFLDEASARIFDTTAATLTRLANAFKMFLASFGGGALEPIKQVAEYMIGVLKWLAELPSGVQTTIVAITALVAVFAAMKVGLALTTAGVIAFRTVIADAGIKGGVSIGNLVNQLRLLNGELVKDNATGMASRFATLRTELTATSGAAARTKVALSGIVGMINPWAIALGAATIGLTMFMQAQADTKARVDELTESLDQQTGAFTENTRASVYGALKDDGTIDRAKKLGIALDDLVDAALDPTSEAFKRLEEAEREALNGRTHGHLGTLGGEWESVLDAVRARQSELKDAQQALDDQQSAGVESGSALIGTYDEMGDAAEDAAAGADVLAKSLADVVDGMFGIVGGQAAVYEAMQGLGESLAENGTTFDIASEAGRANVEALENTLTAMAEMVDAQIESGQISASEGADLFYQYYTDLMGMLAENGVDTSQFEYFKQFLMANFAEPTPVNLDTSPALNNLQTLAEYGQQVMNALMNQGVSKGMAASGARYAAQGEAARRAGTLPKNSVPTPSFVIPKAPTPTFSTGRANDVMEYYKARKEAELLEKAQKEQEKAGKAAAKAAKDQADSLSESEKMADAIAEHQKLLKEAMDETMRTRYGFADALDKVELQFISMREKIQSAKDEVKSLREEQRKLNQEAADARIEARQATLFAGIAQQYGDTERYEKFRNDADKANATVREKTAAARAAEDNARALDKDMLALQGNSKAAIENRGAVRQLQQAMIEAIIEYDNAGHSQQEVAAYAEQLRGRFKQQLTQMGYNEQQVEDLSRVFIDLRRDILNVPTAIKIKAEADTAEAKRKIDELAKGRTVPLKFSGGNQDIGIAGNMNVNDINARKANVYEFGLGSSAGRVASSWGGGMPKYARGGVIPGKRPANALQDNMLAMVNGGQGLVAVQSGEGIVNAPALARMGGPAWLDAVNNMKIPAFTQVVSGGGGTGGSGIQMVELLPHQMQQLASMISTIVTLDSGAIAQATNNHNLAAARRGRN